MLQAAPKQRSIPLQHLPLWRLDQTLLQSRHPNRLKELSWGQKVPPALLHTRPEGRQQLRDAAATDQGAEPRAAEPPPAIASTPTAAPAPPQPVRPHERLEADPSQTVPLDDEAVPDKELNLDGASPESLLHESGATQTEDKWALSSRRRLPPLWYCGEGLRSMSEDNACSTKSPVFRCESD